MTEPRSAAELRDLVRRRAAVGRVTEGRPSGDPARSCLGRISRIGRGEAWPSAAGRPMRALAQLNLTEAGFAPPELDGLAFIAVWIDAPDGELTFPGDRPNGDGWEVRAYGSIDDLVDVSGPSLPGVRPRELNWEVVDDYPAWDDLVSVVGPDLLRDLLAGRDASDLIGSPAGGPKLGGWPSLIQSEIYWAPYNAHPASPAYAFQVDGEERCGLGLWDGGVIHVGLGSADGQPVWVAESQCM